MISGFTAQALLWLLGIFGAGGLVAFGWKAFKNWIAQREKDHEQKELVETLKEQRDSPVDSVADADSLWDKYKPGK